MHQREPDEDGFPEQALRLPGGILDNLEIILAGRKQLPTTAARRLGHAAGLAFDLKDGLRLLAGYSERDPEPETRIPR